MPSLLDTSLPGFETLASRPRAALSIVHGLAEYADRYRDHARMLADRGISCFAFDQIGHRAADAARAHVDRFDLLVEDLNRAIDAVRGRHPQLPLFLWGHSMGTVVVTLAAPSRADVLKGIITSSNSLEIFRRGPNPLNAFFRLAARRVPRVRIPLGLDPARISHDESIQRAYATDPRIPATASLRLIVEFAGACERSRELAAQISLPWLVVHGEADAIAPARGARVLFERLASRDKQLVIYPGLRHEVHNEREPDRSHFMALMAQWILARGAAGAGQLSVDDREAAADAP
jgi:alpha-beta hydrolase superfamily lysophospholipase